MKTRYIIPILILIFAQTGFAQIRCVLLDVETNEPIDYANIWIENHDVGTFSNQYGFFSLVTNSTSEKIIITHVGYNTKHIFIKEIKDTIFLNPIILKLNTVIIAKKKNKKNIIIDEIKENDVVLYFGTDLKYPWIIAKYFPYDAKFENLRFLKKISLITGIDQKADFNIRIYSASEDGKPYEYLSSENIIATAKKGFHKTEVDISKLNILFPKDGLFIAIENIKDVNSPKFKNTSLVLGLDLSNKSQSTYFYYKGEWLEKIDSAKNKENKMLNLFKAVMIELTLSD